MFYYLEGKVAHVEPYLAVIDCGGVGYACRTTNHTIRQLKKGEVKRLYTYLNVGDGIFELYGFATEQELLEILRVELIQFLHLSGCM